MLCLAHFLCLSFALCVLAQSAKDVTASVLDSPAIQIRPGLYHPVLHGGYRGKYIPDESGKYHHVPVAYNGGYGDRGAKYAHSFYNGNDNGKLTDPDYPSAQANTEGGIHLGPKDHVRFMIDFNLNDNGWRILQFDWVRDESPEYQYHFVDENKLWPDEDESETTEVERERETETAEPPLETASDSENVHVAGEYSNQKYNVSYANDEQEPRSKSSVRNAIEEILAYIQTDILPSLP